MDISKVKNLFENKTKADKITREVKKQIKETIWEKQNQREGFTETFKPLISQFEKPVDNKTVNIYTQNQKMLENQLALMKNLKKDRQAITQGFNQFERLADMRELPGFVDEDEDEESKKKGLIKLFNKYLDEKFTEDEKNILKQNKYDLKKIVDGNVFKIKENYDYVNKDIDDLVLKLDEREKKKRKSRADKYYIETNKKVRKTLEKYADILEMALNEIGSKTGKGLNTNEIIDRLKLLGGSIMAGNDGVIPEFTQLSNYLNAMGILSNKELQKLMSMIKVTTS